MTLYRSPSTWGRGGKRSACDYALVDARTGETKLVTDDEKAALRERKRSRGKLRVVALAGAGSYRPVFETRRVWSKRARRVVLREVLVGWTRTAEEEARRREVREKRRAERAPRVGRTEARDGDDGEG